MQVINQIGCLFADRSVEKSGIFDESLSLSLSLSLSFPFDGEISNDEECTYRDI